MPRRFGVVATTLLYVYRAKFNLIPTDSRKEVIKSVLDTDSQDIQRTMIWKERKQ